MAKKLQVMKNIQPKLPNASLTEPAMMARQILAPAKCVSAMAKQNHWTQAIDFSPLKQGSPCKKGGRLSLAMPKKAPFRRPQTTVPQERMIRKMMAGWAALAFTFNFRIIEAMR